MDRNTKLGVHMIGFFLGTATCFFLTKDSHYLLSLIGVIAGYLTCFFLNRDQCNHEYKLLHSREILRVSMLSREEHHTGYIKIYECEHCKKMKKEQVEVN